MQIKKNVFILFLFPVLFFCSAFQSLKNTNTYFQYSSFGYFSNGNYLGNISFCKLKCMGDFGLGTINYLDGELTVLHGVPYIFKTDGKLYHVTGSTKTPFVCLTFFQPKTRIVINKVLDFAGIQTYLDSMFPSENSIYAIEITGKFDYLKVRSVNPSSKPFPSLSIVIKNQVVFERTNIEGTLVGFRCPSSNNIMFAGYHFHFLSNDKKFGGHVLDFKAANLQIKYQLLDKLFMFNFQ